MAALLRTQLAISALETFVQRTSFNSLEDSYIVTLCVQSIAVSCISEVEAAIAQSVKERISEVADLGLASFLSKNLASIIKKTSKADVAKTIQMFGDSCRAKFNDKLTDFEQTSYYNVVEARHNIAHRDGSPLSMDDLSKGVAAAEKMIAAFRECIQQAEPS